MAAPKRSLDVVSATTLVVASMIGVGVYTTSGFTLVALGTPERVMAAWITGGLIAICGAIGYASLATRFTESGGEYLFLSKAFHPVAGLMAGWVSLLAGFTGAIAVAAIGLEEYVLPMLPFEDLPSGSIAISVVAVAAILHTIGVRSAARIQDLFVIVKLIMIAGFIVYAFGKIGSWQGLAEIDPVDASAVSEFSLLEFANQLVWISFSYAGFNAAVYIASEVKSPERNVPRALVAGTLLVTAIYVILNLIFVLAPTPAEITADQNISQVAATAAFSLGGDVFANLVRIVIIVSLFTSVSALVMTGPRVYAKMADDGFFPAWFRFHDRPPIQAIWFQAIFAGVAISLADLKELIGYMGLTLSLSSALTVSMLFWLRLRGDKIKMAWFGIPAALYVVSTLILAVLFGIGKPEQAGAAAITVVIGLLLYPFLKHRSPKADQVDE